MNPTELVAAIITTRALAQAIGEAQKYVLQYQGWALKTDPKQEAITPEVALRAVQQGLAEAARLAERVSPANFEPAVCRKARPGEETDVPE
jgi:hypothetical protein